MLSALSVQKEHAIQLQSKRKRTTATENQVPKAKKTDSIFVKEAHIENAPPAIRTFSSCLQALQLLMG